MDTFNTTNNTTETNIEPAQYILIFEFLENGYIGRPYSKVSIKKIQINRYMKI